MSEVVECGPEISRFEVGDVVSLDEAVRIFDTLRDHPRQLLGTVFVVGDRSPAV